MPLVSFVVMSYNFRRFLPASLDSILRQTGDKDFEVIVVDDASPDHSAYVARAYADPRIRLIAHEQNLGSGATLADGLRAARGAYVARIDGDDRYRPGYLEATVPILEQYPEVGLVYGDVAAMDEWGAIQEDPWTGIRSRETHGGRDFKGYEYISQIKENVIPAPTIIARREAWADTLPIPYDFAFRDWYLNLRIARRWQLYYLARTLADYRIHGQGLHLKLKMVRDRSFESTVLRTLDQVFSEDDWAVEKGQIRRSVYAGAYLGFGDHYRGLNMLADARRCYVKALLIRPSTAAAPHLAKGILATLFPRAWERARSLARRAPAGQQ